MSIKYRIDKELGIISQSEKGWTKELNLVSFNDNEAKYDLREWSPDKSRMGKGVRFTKEELVELRKLLEDIK